MKKTTRFLTVSAFAFTGFLIAAILFLPRDVIPKFNFSFNKKNPNEGVFDFSTIDIEALRMAKSGEEPRIALADNEITIAVITGDFDADGAEEQVAAYRNFSVSSDSVKKTGAPIYITFIDYDEKTGEYTRVLNQLTPAVNPVTLALYTQDLIGDHSDCILVTGMNEKDEKTLSVFKWIVDGKINKIAEIVVDGDISIKETLRPIAYGQGVTGAQSYAIQVRKHDEESANALDQIETIWEYNGERGVYEEKNSSRLPGAQIGTRTFRDILNGSAAQFEQFLSGLWYHVSDGGTIDTGQYIYFDIENREIIFFGENIQQVYTWRNSSPTRFGIYVSSQNISVPTMNRILNLELESTDSIIVRVFEDVRMKIQVNAPWDGSYRKVIAESRKWKPRQVTAFINVTYSTSFGKLSFFKDGSYEVRQGGVAQTSGVYSFFALDGGEFLEMAPRSGSGMRETYRVERDEGENAVKLFRVRLGTQGLQEYHESPLTLKPDGATESGAGTQAPAP
ncbi:MAG: pallilysin-related adhesin [Spirochaetaceae bacterium]|jgi:hypothetical protein|nr:pallilysin-related adhesin [Spirochaetaceae bacterium]